MIQDTENGSKVPYLYVSDNPSGNLGDCWLEIWICKSLLLIMACPILKQWLY